MKRLLWQLTSISRAMAASLARVDVSATSLAEHMKDSDESSVRVTAAHPAGAAPAVAGVTCVEAVSDWTGPGVGEW